MEDIEKSGAEQASGGGDTALEKPSFKARFDNFWYHYKWHTIVALFLIVTISVCSIQMCRRTTYDIHITYAGYYEIERGSVGGSSPYNEAVTSFKKLCEDFDGDGEINVSLETLFVVSEAEKEMLIGSDGKFEINEALVKEDTDTLSSILVYGDRYLFFVSESVYMQYENEEAFGGKLFLPLGEYASGNTECVFVTDSKTGVYLNSLAISKLLVLCDLPDDTVICVRAQDELSQVFNKSKNEENYRRAVEVIKNIFEYK